MKSTGIVRKIDNLGRIVLPKELRKVFEIEEGTPMEIFVDGEQVILREYQPTCVFCGEAEDVVKWKGKNICKKCLSEIKNMQNK